ncbi:uncharacterized protein METZ01_LOCUS324298 [marine metagenome]|uniref:LPP20 lipoprotein n=1 Tax=marine metagenome TaxID=408172 RepID=A0A382PDH6_9ZZZZ
MKHLLLVGLIVLFGACTSIPQIPEPPKALIDYKAPKWVLVGGGAFSDDEGKAFYGVGSATGIKNYSLQRQIADDRARADLAKVFEYYVETLTKDYQAHTTAGSFATSSEEQNAEAAVKVVVSSTLRGVTIIDHFEIPERAEMISLARLDYDAFKQNVVEAKEFKQLPNKVRQDIKDRADALHDEMEAEAKKLAESRGFFEDNGME